MLPGYEILGRLGRGAGAVISLARDGVRGRQVAIKHVVRNAPEDDRFIAQAENEFEIARGLDHPCLRQYFDLVRVKKWMKVRELVLVMEYVAGERLEDKRPERLEALLTVFTHVAEGLRAMHQAGFVHADIKPNNILLTRDGVKIIDFGQSCPLGHRKERVQGTPDYIAPEQVHRHPLDQRTDVYNLGAMMYNVVTGKFYKTLINVAPPGAARIALESIRANDPPHEVNPRVPLPLSKLIMECCAESRDDRPRDMREVLARLELVRHLHAGTGAQRRRRSGGAHE
jgi:eukaryotic-like serine/threonine-protein kinase